MRFSRLSLLTGLAALAAAEDVLFVDTFEYDEYTEATTTLGLTAKVVTVAEWQTMSTADFAAYKAIVLADPDCSSDPTVVSFLSDTKATWGPAVQGNIVLIGTDPTFHFSSGTAGAGVLIDNAIKFAAAGVSSTGASQTGLYFALSCYYTDVDSATVDALSYFGDFEVRGNLDCYNEAHIVASSPALGTLDDAALSDWSCSVHEAFSVYPSVGVNGFQALAIAKDIIGAGSQTFGDGTIGLPYIISRGATPAGCGNGVWESAFGEECDDGKNNGASGDPCSISCKCLSGRPAGDGHCLPPLTNSTSSSSSYKPSGSPIPYANSTVTTTATVVDTTTFCPAPYVTPSPPTVRIIGVEIIVFITIIEQCSTIGGSTVTSYSTSTCSTMNKPIWNTETPGYPCYVCAMSSAGVPCPSNSFITASATSCINPPLSYSPQPPVILPCSTCLPYTLSTCPAYTVPPSGSVYIVPATTVVPHIHSQETTTAAATSMMVAPSASKTMQASGTLTPFTGSASKVRGAEAGMMALSGAIMIAALAF